VEFSLREARITDFDTLWRIDQACFPPGIAYSRLELGVYMKRKGALTLLAETIRAKTKSFAGQPSTVLGFVIVQVEAGNTGHVITVDIVEKFRRSGVGSRLLATAESRLTQAGCAKVRLETMATNAAAIRFYEKHGYTAERTEPGYYSNGSDALLMVKSLHSA
jgi:ribosomal-protein-alanine N-acetyltransferase